MPGVKIEAALIPVPLQMFTGIFFCRDTNTHVARYGTSKTGIDAAGIATIFGGTIGAADVATCRLQCSFVACKEISIAIFFQSGRTNSYVWNKASNRSEERHVGKECRS